MSTDPLLPAVQRPRRFHTLAASTAGVLVGATTVVLLWGRPEPLVIETAPDLNCPDLSCAEITCPEAPACPSLNCAAPAPEAVVVPALELSPEPSARKWSSVLSKDVDEYLSPDGEGYASVALGGDFVVAVLPYIPEESCSATPGSSPARAYDRKTGKHLWTITVDDWTNLVSTSAGLLLVTYDKGPDTNALRFIDRKKKTLWSTEVDECRAYTQVGKWLVDVPGDPRCVRDLASGAIYKLPKGLSEGEKIGAYWKQLGVPTARMEIQCPRQDELTDYSKQCDEQGMAVVKYQCKGDKCRTQVDYTPWTAPLGASVAR